MAQTGTPVVRADYLHVTGCQPLPVGSDEWFTWLQTARLFSYQASHGDRLTLRKEKRRRGDYWYAYLKRDRKLHNAYAGRPDSGAVGVPADPVAAKGTWLRPLADGREGLPLGTDLALNRDVLKN